MTATEFPDVDSLRFEVNGKVLQVTSPTRGDTTTVNACDFALLLPTAEQAEDHSCRRARSNVSTSGDRISRRTARSRPDRPAETPEPSTAPGQDAKNGRATSLKNSRSTRLELADDVVEGHPRRCGPPAGRPCFPSRPSAAASAAAMPKRVASTRSNAVGVPPRWTWPRIVTRVSNPVRPSISEASSVDDATEPLVTEPVHSRTRACSSVPSAGHRAFGDHHDRGVVHAGVAALERVAHLGDVERHLGDQHHRGAAGDARPHRDVAGVAAHDLDHDHPVVRLGGGVEPIDRGGRDVHRGVEPEGDLGGARCRCRSSSAPRCTGTPSVCRVAGDAQCPFAADDDEPVEVVAGRCVALTVLARRRGTRTAGSATFPRMVPPRGRIPRHRLTSRTS